MKIVWISHSAGLAGSERSFLEGARGFQARGHTILPVLPADGPLAEQLRALGLAPRVESFTLWTSSGRTIPLVMRCKRLARNLKATARLTPFLQAEAPDLVVTNTLTTPVGMLSARRAKVPHVVHVRELDRPHHRLHFDWGAEASLGLLNRFSGRVIVNSRAVEAGFSSHFEPRKIRLVYNAVEVPPPWDEWRKDQSCAALIQLVCVGMMTPGKRQADAIRAVSSLVKRGVDAKLTLIGKAETQYGAELQRLIRELKLEDRVELVPFTPDPFARMSACDIALMPSENEPFGRVTVEAMKLGLPVVGAQSGGTPEIIRDGHNGLLYPLGDIEIMAQKIEMLAQNRARLQTMGENARQDARAAYSLETYTLNLTRVFEEAIAEHKR